VVANVDATFVVVVRIVMILVVVVIVVMRVRRIDHAVVAIPALVARTVPVLVDNASADHQGRYDG
jgi:hypothetical protein